MVCTLSCMLCQGFSAQGKSLGETFLFLLGFALHGEFDNPHLTVSVPMVPINFQQGLREGLGLVGAWHKRQSTTLVTPV